MATCQCSAHSPTSVVCSLRWIGQEYVFRSPPISKMGSKGKRKDPESEDGGMRAEPKDTGGTDTGGVETPKDHERDSSHGKSKSKDKKKEKKVPDLLRQLGSCFADIPAVLETCLPAVLGQEGEEAQARPQRCQGGGSHGKVGRQCLR